MKHSVITLVHRAVLYSVIVPSLAIAQLDFESEPINYHSAEASNSVERLIQDIEAGRKHLTHSKRFGYLQSILDQLDVPISSQVLVFSKTSFQQSKISPRRPRAVYFNDDVYVGWVQRGDVVEFSAADDNLGAVFYTLDQKQVDKPFIARDQGHCISCHASSKTSGVPGHLVRSVYPNKSGHPEFRLGTFTTDYRSPFSERWGGWYVSGTHGEARHMGNAIIGADEDRLDVDCHANTEDLTEIVKVAPYLSPHSDIVALMVLEHQTRMHNLIARASMETRSAIHYDGIMNQTLGRDPDYRSDTTKRRISNAADKLVECMLFVDEFELTSPVTGTSEFAKEFTSKGPFDSEQRSLREFDLTSRMMKYPCSHLIYSKSFDSLPKPTKDIVYEKLFAALTEQDADSRFDHLTRSDRKAILDILRETKEGLPSSWF